MRKFVGIFLGGITLTMYSLAWATGPYASAISKLQATTMGNAYNTVFLTMDVTDSPCSSTNQYNRFTIVSDVQHSTILAAIMADKTISITGTGVCNGASIEEISSVSLSP